MRIAITVGIGLFLAIIALKSAGVVAASPATFVTLGDLHKPSTVLAVLGFLIVAVLSVRKVRGALLAGILLCNARAMGEFGAVAVVSGHIRGETNTLPLHVEILYNEYQFVGAFAVAALLASLALVTLCAKLLLERLSGRRTLLEH